MITTNRMCVIWFTAFIVCFGVNGCKAQSKTPLKENNMENVRNPILAGSWYPKDPVELGKTVEDYINSAHYAPVEGRVMGIVSPHAGFVFSGAVMGASFSLLKKQLEDYPLIKTVVILGFSHKGDGAGRISVWAKGSWKTPLGTLDIDEELAKTIVDSSPVMEFNASTHANEHSIEILLPFLQVAAKGHDFKIVPVSFSFMNMQEVDAITASLISAIDGRDDVILLASTDMSH
jgi:AmmeMemoRadiSam system protein B